jgi:hypothetical protein
VQAGGYRSIEGRLMQIPTDERSLPHTLLGPITTARELASLWAMIWRDEAGPRAACARVRAAAGQQHLKRLELGFDADAGIIVASNEGTIPASSTTTSGASPFPMDAATPPAVHPRPDRVRRRTSGPAHHRRPRRHGDTKLAT